MTALDPVAPGEGREPADGGLGPRLALTICFVLAAFGVVGPAAHLALPATELPPPFPSQHQDAENIAFVFTFAIALPAALLLIPRLIARLGRSAALLDGVAAVLSVALVGGVVVLKAADSTISVGGASALLVAALLWWAVAGTLLGLLSSGRARGFLGHLESVEVPLWWLALALLAIASLSFVDISALALVPALIGVLAVAGIVGLYRSGFDARIALSGWAGRVADAVVVVLLLLAVPNIVIFDLSNPLVTHVIQFHQDFFIGPANQVIHGGAMLTDTLSQYGVGSIYLVAGWFELVPAGNGTLGFLDNVLVALVFVGAFGVVRLAGASRLIATTTMAVAVVALVFDLDYPLGALLQHGAIRFGLPVIVIAAATFEFARPRLRRPAQVVELLGVGLSSIWALEAFAYTLVTAAAVLAVRLWLYPRAERLRTLGRWVAASLAACVGFHVVLALATLAIAGELPDWGWYLNTLREFLTGSVGELTYDFVPWTAALAVGALYVASAAALVLLLARRPDLARSRPERAVALAATTAWGIALFSYFVNRSAEHILPYIGLPAAMLVAIWLALLLEGATAAPRRVRYAGLASALVLAVVLVGSAWPRVHTLYSQSLLAHVVPGGPSLGSGFDRLWHPPDLTAGASSGAELIRRCIPDSDSAYVLTDADRGIEILAKAERRNAFPLADPWEDSFVPDTHIDELEAAVAGLERGDRMLVDADTLEAFRIYHREPDRDPLASPVADAAIVPTGLAKLQDWLVKEIGRRYVLRTVCEAPGEPGLRVVELVPRSA